MNLATEGNVTVFLKTIITVTQVSNRQSLNYSVSSSHFLEAKTRATERTAVVIESGTDTCEPQTQPPFQASYLAPRAMGRPLEASAHLKQSVAFCDHVGKPLRGRQVLTEVLLIRLPGGVFLLYDSVIEGQSCKQIPNSRASGNTEPVPFVFASRPDADPDPRLSHFQVKTLITRPRYSESGYKSDSSR